MSQYFLLDQSRNAGNVAGRPCRTLDRRLLAILIPIAVVHTVWLTYMLVTNSFHLFTEKIGGHHHPRWLLSITMVFGSMVAGATSEGGGAIAFPVLTLILNVAPVEARDFSFLIQSVGMTSAVFSILYMDLNVEYGSVLYCTAGGFFGVIFGLEIIAPNLQPAYSKMYFVCIWFSFAASLVWYTLLNEHAEVPRIQNWPKYSPSNWRSLVLLLSGFIGGICSSIGGSGLDICSFAVLTLVFRVSARVATPTSVILMAINTVVAFLYRLVVMQAVDPEVYNLWLVCVPVVVVGAPLGALISSHFHSHVLVALVCLVDTVQLVGALYVVQPWTTQSTDRPVTLCVTSALVLCCGGVFFSSLGSLGRMLKQRELKLRSDKIIVLVDQVCPMHALHEVEL